MRLSRVYAVFCVLFFFFNDTATTEIYTLSLHDALPIYPEDDEAMNRRQAQRLKDLGDYVHSQGQKFMFELLVPMTKDQHDRLEGDQHLFDHDLRPSLMIGAIKELQGYGVEPDVWKIEGLDR